MWSPHLGFNAKTIDLEDFNPEVLMETERAIFLMATYGEGEPTDNAIAFTKWMKNTEKELSAECLSKLKYSVFGLGNKQYEHYNLMGKATDTCLGALGASRMFEYGEGDDDATLEEDFDAWRSQLWPALTAAFHPDAAVVEEMNTRARLGSMDAPSKVKLDFKAVKTEEKSITGTAAVAAIDSHTIHASTRHFFTAPRAEIVVNRELRNIGNTKESAAEAGSTRHIEINLKGVKLHYQTADNLAILPENSTDNVAALASSQGYDLDQTFVLQKLPSEDDVFKHTFPTPCTVREALTLYYDIQGPIKQALLKHLLPYVSDQQQLAWLTDILHKDNRAALKALSEEGGKNLCDLLANELSSCKIPLSDILHIVPFIQPRYYTISSSSSVHPDNVHVTIAITDFITKTGKQFLGLTSGYVTTSGSTNCRVFVRPSSFRLPPQLSTPIIMVGPGTGLAPMRALLQERKFQQTAQQGTVGPKNILFFGCKNRAVDYIYSDELEAYEKEGVLTKLHTAFSRDAKEKVYVQHLMVQPETAQELLGLLLNQGAYIYVCGATAMGADVMAAFIKILQEQNNMSTAQATSFIKELQDKGRYVQELWTA